MSQEMHKIVKISDSKYAVQKSSFGFVWSTVWTCSSIQECEAWLNRHGVQSWQM